MRMMVTTARKMNSHTRARRLRAGFGSWPASTGAFILNRYNNFTAPVQQRDLSGAALFDRRQNIRERFSTGFGADVAFAVQAHADVSGIHVPATDDEHSVDLGFFCFLDFAV